MAPRSPYRLNADIIAADRAVVHAVADLNDYTTLNAAYSPEALRQLETTLAEALQAEERHQREAEVIRERVIMAAWALHEAVRGVKAQVVAGFGPESLALHAVGLKKQSERKRPVRRPRPEEA